VRHNYFETSKMSVKITQNLKKTSKFLFQLNLMFVEMNITKIALKRLRYYRPTSDLYREEILTVPRSKGNSYVDTSRTNHATRWTLIISRERFAIIES
jgi:hypothetical protein